MIKINLLPVKKKIAISLIPSVFIYGTIGTIFLIMVLIGFTFHLDSKISRMTAEELAKNQKLSELKTALKEVENFEKFNEEVRKKTEVIEQLKRNQVAPLRLLDEVSEMLPTGVWLTSLVDKSGAVSIEGFAHTNYDLVGYVQNLKASKYLVGVTLVESRQTNLENFTIYKFKLTFTVKV